LRALGSHPFCDPGDHFDPEIVRDDFIHVESLKVFTFDIRCIVEQLTGCPYYVFDILCIGTSDPYVKFKIGGKQLYKSKIVYKELNPYWDEYFTLPVEDAFEPVQVKVNNQYKSWIFLLRLFH
jgi:hypothetical protein